MSAVEPKCPMGWETKLFESARKTKPTTFTIQYPEFLSKPGAYGRSHYEQWVRLPEMPYSAAVDDMYDMDKLNSALRNSPCFLKAQVEDEMAQPVNYGKMFTIGLVMAGAAVLYSMRGSR